MATIPLKAAQRLQAATKIKATATPEMQSAFANIKRVLVGAGAEFKGAIKADDNRVTVTAGFAPLVLNAHDLELLARHMKSAGYREADTVLMLDAPKCLITMMDSNDLDK